MKRLFLSLALALGIFAIPLPSFATVQSTIDKKIYQGDGISTVFSFPYNIYLPTDLAVYETVVATSNTTQLTLNTNYSITLTAISGVTGAYTATINLAGGSSPVGALAVGTQLTILRSLPLTQLINISDYSATPAATWNKALDRSLIIEQQLQEQINRSLLAPVGSTSSTQFPTSSPGTVIGWNSSGGLVNVIPNTGAYLTTSNDGTLSANSDGLIPTQKAVKTYVDNRTSFNVLTYGADPTGTNDSTIAIQAAETAAAVSGGSVYLPTGSYKITSTINVADGVKIYGTNGSNINAWGCNAFTITGSTAANGVEISGLRIKSFSNVGASDPVTYVGVIATGGPYLVNPLFYRINVHDNYFEGWSVGVQYQDVWMYTIDNNAFASCHTMINLVDLSSSGVVTRNKALSWAGTSTTTTGVSITYSSYASEGVDIDGNDFSFSAYGIYAPVGGLGIKVTHNDFASSINCILANSFGNWTISDNPYMVNSSGSNYVIEFTASNVISGKETIISNNGILNYGTGGGIEINNNNGDFVITGNLFSVVNSNQDISTDTGVQNVVISNNVATLQNILFLPFININRGTNITISNNINMKAFNTSAYTTNVNMFNNTFTQQDTSLPSVPTTGTWNSGDIIYKSYNSSAYTAPQQSSIGDILGWKCTSSGTFGSGSTTANTVVNTNVITNVASMTGFTPGEYVTVSTGFDSATAPMQILAITNSPNTITLDTLSHSNQTGATVALVNPVFTAFGQNGYRSGSGSPSGVLTPYFIGEQYFDTGGNWYLSIGTGNTNWVLIPTGAGVNNTATTTCGCKVYTKGLCTTLGTCS